jgi:hypothetical protein
MLWIPLNIGQSLVLGMVPQLGDEKLYDDRVTSGGLRVRAPPIE